MRFLVDEDLPRSTGKLLERYGHEVIDWRDTSLRGGKDPQVASYARRERLCLLTGDLDFSDIRNYPPDDYAGLVVLKLQKSANASLILAVLESFLQQEELVSRIGGNLAIVEPGRVRIRIA